MIIIPHVPVASETSDLVAKRHSHNSRSCAPVRICHLDYYKLVVSIVNVIHLHGWGKLNGTLPSYLPDMQATFITALFMYVGF